MCFAESTLKVVQIDEPKLSC